MRKTSIGLQELRRKIYSKAKTEKRWRFWGLYCHICKKEVLEEAYWLAKANGGAPGIDGRSFEDIEAEGVEGFLEGIRQELRNWGRTPIRNWGRTPIIQATYSINFRDKRMEFG